MFGSALILTFWTIPAIQRSPEKFLDRQSLLSDQTICFTVLGHIFFFAGNPDVEYLLNLVWLVLAVASLLLWAIYALSFPYKHRYFTAIIALICIICFLFPVISLNDDLLGNPALCETTKLKKRVSVDLAHAVLSATQAPPVAEPRARRAVNLHAEVCLPSRDLVWSNYDRRPPPQHS